ncbi:MAG: hypothetical protein AB1442_01250 [Nitrospirota bacterium]
MIPLFMSLTAIAYADDKIYTNEDLLKYQIKREAPLHLESIAPISDFDSSFYRLRKYIQERLKVVKSPEYKKYLQPLSSGMTQEQVGRLWGIKTVGGMHEEAEDKRFIIDIRNYEIGVSLYFRNDALKGWKRFESNPYSAPGVRKEDPEKEDEKVLISISGCPTLQDGLDGENSQTGYATFWVVTHGRTTEEICDTVGRGCKSCKKLSQRKSALE